MSETGERRAVLGVIGHVDHGKTALVRALTGMETDRLAEEKRRGISIALGFAHFAAEGGTIDLIDMPGHERFIRTMVSGATGIDAVLLVVAANEGIKPQTLEHVHIAALLGVARAVIAVTKADLVSRDEAGAAARAACALARDAGLAAGAPLLVSARTGEGIGALKQAIAETLSCISPPPDDGFAYLPVDRAFSVAGYGTVVTGTLRHGRLTAGDSVGICPSGVVARVRGLQVHGARVAEAAPGMRVAVNLRGVDVEQVKRGAALAAPSILSSAIWISVELRMLHDAPVLHAGAPLVLLHGTDEAEVRLRLLDRDELAPGATALAQLRCARPVALPGRDRFILRTASPVQTIGGGRVLDPMARRMRTKDADILARLGAIASGSVESIVEREVAQAQQQGVALARIARIAGIAPARVQALLQGSPAVVTPAGAVVSRTAFDALRAQIANVLAEAPPGLSIGQLHGLLKGVSAAVLAHAVTQLAAAGALRVAGGSVHLVRLADERARARAADMLAARLAETFRQAGVTPPDPATIATSVEARRILDRLVRDGVLVRAPDRVQKRVLLFHRDAVQAACRVLEPLLTGDGLLVKDAGAALGISRKFSVPLLEYLDATGFTRRVADRRVLGRAGQMARLPAGCPAA